MHRAGTASPGAIGLLLGGGVVRIAAYGLIGLLVAMFPANVHAARMQLSVAGQPAMPLTMRLPLVFHRHDRMRSMSFHRTKRAAVRFEEKCPY